jgi:hypothetical protein
MSAALEWASGLRALSGGVLSSSAAERAQTVELHSAELDSALAGWCRSRDLVLGHFADWRASALREELDSHFSDAADLLTVLQETVGDIEEWMEYRGARERLEELGVADVASFCEAHRVPADAVPEVVERACLESWVDSILRTDVTRLGRVRADQLTQSLRTFVHLTSSSSSGPPVA